MILACKNINKSFGINKILSNISFHIEDKEKIAIVGSNGAGKTTLFKIIMGELPADEGQVILSKSCTIGYLSQHQSLNPCNSIYEELLTVKKNIIDLENNIRDLEKSMKFADEQELRQMMQTYSRLTHEFEVLNGYSYKSEIHGVLKGLGFEEDDFTKLINTLSGGQKTRVSLAKLLLSNANVLLLDEPTNHLDMTSIAWLESYLASYKGSVIIISHDRYFLDKIVTRVIEIENTNATIYNGNYSNFAYLKAMQQDIQLKQYLNQQKEIKRQEEVIQQLRAFNREKSVKRANSREKMLDKVDRIAKPIIHQSQIELSLEPQIISGNDVLYIENLSKSFGDNKLFENVNIDIKRGEKVALIGNNGTGKTTILKLITDSLSPDTGHIKLGSKVRTGYYDQEHQVLNPDNDMVEELSDAYPNLTITQIRNVLAAFLFTGDDVFKKIATLSGGEKGRVALAKLMLSEANLLLLDEPTNHLDIMSKEILENAIHQYTGTIFYVSHDRYFINKTADRILELTPTGVINYLGNYDYYVEKKLEQVTAIKEEIKDKTVEVSSSKDDWIKKKEEQARERKRQNDLVKVEGLIHDYEARSGEIDELLCLEEVYTDASRLIELNGEKKELEEKLEALYEEWEELAE